MAKMIPPEPRPSTSSSAELRLFDTIRTQLGNDWVALHSLGLANHLRKHWAEVDFVLIGPPGIYCLEVKGGRVARHDGDWHFTDRYERTSMKAEGPFEQVKSATFALRDYLTKSAPGWIFETVFAWGVAFPDIEFKEIGPDIEPRIVYDVRDIDKTFGAYMRRLADYWHERTESMRTAPITTLSSLQVQQIYELLRGDFDFRPSLRTRVGQVTDELLRLTGEQYAVMNGLSANRRMLIRGGAGTGKTLLAVEEARRLAREGKRVFFCCFNRHLAHFLRTAMQDQSNVEVYNIHGFMKKIVYEVNLEHRLPAADEADLFAVFYPELTVEALLQGDLMGGYEALIIDEGQDLLLDTYLDVFDGLLAGGLKDGVWRVFLDHGQDVFGGTSPNALHTLLAANPAEYMLGVNCRNTRPIAMITRLVSGVGTLETLRVDGPEIEQRWYRDAHQQLRDITNCINRLLGDGLQPADIIILARYRLENSILRNGLRSMSVRLVEFDLTDRSTKKGFIRFATAQSFKGLESDAIVFVDLDDLLSPEALRAFYIGSSRARAYLALFIHESQRSAYELHAEEFGRWLKDHAEVWRVT